MNTPRWAAAAAAAAAILALAACGSSGSSTPAAPGPYSPPASASAAGVPSPPPTAGPASPVPLLRQVGATPAAGTVTGQYDVYGDRYASGTIGSEDVRAYTAADAAAYQANLATAWHPDDSQAVIAVPARNAVVILTAYIDPAKGDGPQWAPGGTAAQVAARVGGTVVAP